MKADWLNFKSRAYANQQCIVLLLTSCIATSEKFEVNKRTLFGGEELAY